MVLNWRGKTTIIPRSFALTYSIHVIHTNLLYSKPTRTHHIISRIPIQFKPHCYSNVLQTSATMETSSIADPLPAHRFGPSYRNILFNKHSWYKDRHAMFHIPYMYMYMYRTRCLYKQGYLGNDWRHPHHGENKPAVRPHDALGIL